MPNTTPAAERRDSVQWQLFDPSSVAIFGDLYRQWFENAAKISQEITEVTINRLQKDIAVWAKLTSCRDPKDFVEFQRNLAEELTTGVVEDAEKVGQKIASVWKGSVTKEAA